MKSLAFATLAAVLAVAMGVAWDSHFTYQGRYPGYCLSDGIYVHDFASLIFCSGGVATVQKCAPGTRTSHAAIHKLASLVPHGHYGYGYVMQILCDEHVPVHREPVHTPWHGRTHY